MPGAVRPPLPRSSPPPAPPERNGYAGPPRYASWDALLAAAPLPERDLELPGGLLVRIRKLSRLAQHELQARALVNGQEDTAAGERILLRYGLVAPAVPDDAAARALQEALDPAVVQALYDGLIAFSRLGPPEVAADDAKFPAADAGRGPGL